MSRDPQLSLLPEPTANRNVAWLEELLKSHSGWVTAAQLCWHGMGQNESDTVKRQLRELAAASEWIISGQKGYKHLEHATAEEINHFCNWMESQAKAMTARAEALRRNAHRIFG